MSDTDIDILNPGERVRLIYAAKGMLKLGLSEAVVTILELLWSYDRNRRTFQQDPGGVPTRAPQEPTIIGFNLLLRARF